MATEPLELTPLLPAVQRFVERSHRLLIDGTWVDAASGAAFESVDPSTGDRLAEIAFAGEPDVDRAVDAARRGLSGAWATISPADRERILHRLADLVEDHADELAQLESLDNGKPLTFARMVDLELSISHLRYFAGWPRKIVGQVPARGGARHAVPYAAGARGSVRPDRAVELPAAHGGVEGRAPRWPPAAR